MVSILEKNRLVDFVSKVMEESGFKVYRDFKTSRHLIDIYGILSTVLGDIGVVVAVKNYDEHWSVGLDVLKEMEMVAKTLKASKIVVVTSSYFTDNAINYASRRNIKLIDKDSLITLAKTFSKKNREVYENDTVVSNDYESNDFDEEYNEPYVSNPSAGTPNFLAGRRRNLFPGRTGGQSWITSQTIKGLLNNTLILILFVLLLSSFIAILIQILTQVNTPVLGILKILISAFLSYGIVYLVNKDAATILVKGTTVFFVSLLIYVLLIVL
jgi:Restriction endonuclease